MTITVTPTPRDVRGFTAIRYADGRIHGAVVFNRSGEFMGASQNGAISSTRVRWMDDPEALPPGLLDAARAADLEGL